MKKILFIASALFFMQQANAQYFQHLYGNTAAANTYEQNGAFTPVSSNGTGYMIAGLHYDASYANYNQVHVVRTDDKGNIGGAPYFNYRYLMFDPYTGNPYTAWATSITEVNTGAGFEYVVVGILIYSYTPYEIDAFVMRIDDQGNVFYANRYNFPGYAMKDPRCKMSINQKEILITGRCADQTGTTNTKQDAYILDIDENSGVPNWGKVYDITSGSYSFDDAGADIIENPYSGSPEVIVVGRSDIYGVMFKVDGTNGNPLAATIYKITGLYDEFTCIKASGNPNVSTNDAFLIGGNTNQGTSSAPDFNMWTVLMDQNGTVAWSTDHDNGSSAGLNNYCRDIMERVNTSSSYEAYAIGSIWNSSTDQDVQVVKIDKNGMAVTNGDFRYGVNTSREAGESINFSNTGGFACSGTSSVNNSDQLLINAYFSGETACQYKIHNFTSNTSTPSTASVTPVDYSYPKYDYLKYKVDKLNDNQICYSPTVAGGSNAKQAKVPGKNAYDFAIMASNNGVVTAGSDLSIHVENSTAAPTEARIVDILGREIPCRVVYDNDNLVRVSAPLTHSGVYYLVLTNGSEQKSKAFFVK